jgi:Amt family ammonium transporter
MVIPLSFLHSFKGLAIVVTYSFSVSYGIFKFINWVMPMRVSKAEEEMGLDASQHDEKYVQGTLLVKDRSALTEKERNLAETMNFSEKVVN